MTNAVDPARILVISVGIEAYDYGSDMKLQGAGTEAARFARWALASGVPPEHVWLACALLPDSTTQLPDCKRIGTTRADLEDAFAKDLKNLNADMLLFFWCGHGVLNKKRERALFTSDTYPGMDRNLVVDNILAYLSSDAVTGLKHQILIIDACANFVENMKLGRELPAGTLQPRDARRVDQFSLYSASQGEYAAFDQIRHQSTFSETVLEKLEQQPAGQLPPDMHEFMESMSAHVKEVFQQRHARGESPQTPGIYITQGYPGNERPVFETGGFPVAGNTQRLLKAVGMTVRQAQRVSQAIGSLAPIPVPHVRTEMLALLGDSDDGIETEDLGMPDLVARIFAKQRFHRLLSTFQEHATTDQQRMNVAEIEKVLERQKRISTVLQQFTTVTRKHVNDAFCWALADRPDEHPEDLDDALDRVAAYDGPVSGNLPLHRFVAYLRHETHQPIEDAWFGLSADRLNGLKEEIEDALADTARLIIEVPNGARTPDSFAWPTEIFDHRHLPGHEWTPQETVTCHPSLEGVKKAVRGLLTDMEENYTTSFTLGFMMPRIAFDEFPELWTHGSLYVEETPLWRGRPTMLHSSERHTNKAWNDKTTQISAQLERAEKADVTWISADLQDNPKGILKAIARNKSACYGLAFTPGRFKGNLRLDPLIAALASGAPFVVWAQEDPEDWEAAKTTLEVLVAQGRFEDFPIRLHRLREDEQDGLGAIVRLIWDDPKVLPDTPQLSGMRGA